MIPNAFYLNSNSQLNNDALVICKISRICSPQRENFFTKIAKFHSFILMKDGVLESFTFNCMVVFE
ncbi:hypothetical protein T08_6857 [Trichinella sp. T8]|nr:hypothetical protein T08_6857 [Trichinella sp. T8]